MSASGFHDEPFDEGTLTKLEIFQLYTREWLPVFLARPPTTDSEIHLFDFFAGPGCDANGIPGSPLRTLQVLQEYSREKLAGWGHVRITAHFFDASKKKIKALEEKIGSGNLVPAGVELDTKPLEFAEAFALYGETLRGRNGAKLLLIDQFGVATVTEEVFRCLVEFPRADFLFFISSNTLRRFRDHPAIKQKIRPTADHYQVHRAVLDYYREFLPSGKRYYLAPFSIRKGGNIYGLIFGSAHPRGIDKFLTVAWKKDRLNGEADFDIDRNNLNADEPTLDFGELFQPTKITLFERALRAALVARRLHDEVDVMELCFAHGVTRQHARPVLKALKDEGVIAIEFQVPDVERLKEPRAIRYP
jgi:three-Cys-motif partner protein